MNPSELIDKVIADLPDWRGKAMADIRRVVHEADADVIEEWKWMGTPVWSHNGLVCAADAHKNIVKMIFFKGASLSDPERLFNAELGGTTRRAIKFGEGDPINEPALKELVRAAVVLNSSKPAAKSASRGERSGEKSRSRG